MHARLISSVTFCTLQVLQGASTLHTVDEGRILLLGEEEQDYCDMQEALLADIKPAEG